MANTAALYALDATQIAARLRSDIITVEEYAQSLLDRIAERDAVVRAWAYLGEAITATIDRMKGS